MKQFIFILWCCSVAFAQNLVLLEVDTATLADSIKNNFTKKDSITQKINWTSAFFNYDSQKSVFTLYGEPRFIIDSMNYDSSIVVVPRDYSPKLILNKNRKSALLEYKGVKLFSDSIVLFQKDQWIHAVGYPYIDDNDNKIYGESIIYNHKKKVGEIAYGSLKKDKNFFNGIHIRRQENANIFISYGDITTCNRFAELHYFFYSRYMVVENKKHAIVKPIILNIADVPVAMLPFMVIPLGKERVSGFTQPKIGGDEAQGFFIKNVGYFFVFNDYADLQSTVDILEGVSGTFEAINFKHLFRYKKGDNLQGNVEFKAFTIGLSSELQNWELNFSHNQVLTPDKRHNIKGSGRIVSSRILSEATERSEAVNQDANFEIGYTGPIPFVDDGSLALTVKQDQNLTTERLTRQFPSLSVNKSGQVFPASDPIAWWHEDSEDDKLKIPFYRKLQYNYTGGVQIFFSRDSLNDPRANLLGAARNLLAFSFDYSLFDYINIKPSIHMSHFWVAHDNPTFVFQNRLDTVLISGKDTVISVVDTINPDQGRWGQNVFLYNTNVRISTQLFGLLSSKWRTIPKVRHTLTPAVNFSYQPKIDTNINFVPPTGAFSASNGQNETRSVGFSLGNEVDIKYLEVKKDSTGFQTGQGKEVSKKIFNMGSSLNYDFEDKDGRKWSDISSNFSTEIIKYVPVRLSIVHTLYDDFISQGQSNHIIFPILKSWNFNWRYDFNYKGKFHTGNFLMTRKSSRWKDWSASARYSIAINSVRAGSNLFNTTVTHSLSAGSSLWVTEGWFAAYRTSYDFLEGRFSSHEFNFTRKLHRWQINFRWTPIGASTGWDFKIYLIDIPDIKIERSSINVN